MRAINSSGFFQKNGAITSANFDLYFVIIIKTIDKILLVRVIRTQVIFSSSSLILQYILFYKHNFYLIFLYKILFFKWI